MRPSFLAQTQNGEKTVYELEEYHVGPSDTGIWTCGCIYIWEEDWNMSFDCLREMRPEIPGKTGYADGRNLYSDRLWSIEG